MPTIVQSQLKQINSSILKDDFRGSDVENPSDYHSSGRGKSSERESTDYFC